MRATRGHTMTAGRARGDRRAGRHLLRIAVVASLLAWTLLALTPMAALAVEVRQGEDVVITAAEVIDDDLYVFGRSVTIRGAVTGDVIAGGQTVTISGPVEGDVLAGGQTVTITGPVLGSVRAAGQTVEMQATVGQDALVAGATVTTSPQAEVGRDLLIGASAATVGGGVGRSVRAASETLTLAAPVGGDVQAQVGALRLTTGADVQGSLTYTSAQEAVLEPGAIVQGVTTRLEQPAAEPQPGPAAQLGEAVVGWLRTLVGMGAVGLLLVLLFPTYSARATTVLAARPWPSLGLGFATLAGGPVAALLLFVVGLLIGGWWIGLALLGLLLALIPVGYTVVGLYLGQVVMQRIGRPQMAAAWTTLAGLALLGLVGVVPVIGGVALFAALLFGLGAALLTLAKRYQEEPVAEGAASTHAHDLGEPIPAR